jgi:hypothetical protein
MLSWMLIGKHNPKDYRKIHNKMKKYTNIQGLQSPSVIENPKKEGIILYFSLGLFIIYLPPNSQGSDSSVITACKNS